MSNNISEAFAELKGKLTPATLVTELQQVDSKRIQADQLKKV